MKLLIKLLTTDARVRKQPLRNEKELLVIKQGKEQLKKLADRGLGISIAYL